MVVELPVDNGFFILIRAGAAIDVVLGVAGCSIALMYAGIFEPLGVFKGKVGPVVGSLDMDLISWFLGASCPSDTDMVNL